MSYFDLLFLKTKLACITVQLENKKKTGNNIVLTKFFIGPF